MRLTDETLDDVAQTFVARLSAIADIDYEHHQPPAPRPRCVNRECPNPPAVAADLWTFPEEATSPTRHKIKLCDPHALRAAEEWEARTLAFGAHDVIRYDPHPADQ